MTRDQANAGQIGTPEQENERLREEIGRLRAGLEAKESIISALHADRNRFREERDAATTLLVEAVGALMMVMSGEYREGLPYRITLTTTETQRVMAALTRARAEGFWP